MVKSASSNPLYILAVYAPGIAGIFLVWRTYGLKGLSSFLRSIDLIDDAPAYGGYTSLLGIPVIAYLSRRTERYHQRSVSLFPLGILIFPALARAFFLGPLEEFGWRGVALPLLQRKMAPFWAGLVVGVIVAAWHYPCISVRGAGLQYGAWALLPFFGGVIAIYVILTPLFNSSRGKSSLIAYLYHFQMMNPIFPDAQPWDNLVFGIAAVVIR